MVPCEYSDVPAGTYYASPGAAGTGFAASNQRFSFGNTAHDGDAIKFTSIYGRVDQAPGTGETKQFLLNISGVGDTSLDCTISDTAKTCTTDADVTLAAERIWAKTVVSTSADVSGVQHNVAFEGEFPVDTPAGGGATTQVIMISKAEKE